MLNLLLPVVYMHLLQIKGALLTWLQRDCTVEQPALPPFLRNKLSQAIVAIVKREYPTLWPGFFRELVAAASSGPGLADMFVRIMIAVDEDVISLDIPRWGFMLLGNQQATAVGSSNRLLYKPALGPTASRVSAEGHFDTSSCPATDLPADKLPQARKLG